MEPHWKRSQQQEACIPPCIPEHIIRLQGLIYMECTSLPRGTILKKDLEIQGLFFRLSKSAYARANTDAKEPGPWN